MGAAVTDESHQWPDESDKRIDARKQELSNVITETLRRHPLLCYFQGYHDIVQVLLLVLGAEAAPAAAARLSLLRIRDFMLPTMTGALSHLQLLPAILKAADAELFAHLSETAPFYFALPATLTLYAHEIQEYGDIARLFDYLLTNEAVVSIYLYATVSRSPHPGPAHPPHKKPTRLTPPNQIRSSSPANKSSSPSKQTSTTCSTPSYPSCPNPSTSTPS